MRRNKQKLNKTTILLLIIIVSMIFLWMVQRFLAVLFLAAIFSGLAYPVYNHLSRRLGRRKKLASLTTLLLIVVLIFIPFILLLGILTAQAIDIGQSAKPWIQAQFTDSGAYSEYFKLLPFSEYLEEYKTPILEKAANLIGRISRFLINSLSDIAVGTVNFFFMFFILIYAMYYFLLSGPQLLFKMLYYLPLKDQDEQRLLEKFVSVTRATIKGTLIIAILQGVLVGFAFAIIGIAGSVFWGAVVTIFSILPILGSGLVWLPAGIILLLRGDIVQGMGLIVFGALVVGSVDNLLRPRLVGRDTSMPDLMILLSTLGGLAMFGIFGFIIGPIIAALFITVWEIYGEIFKDSLPEVKKTLFNFKSP